MSDPKPPTKCALYLRVSTNEQDLEQQRAVLQRDAAARGWEVVAVYAEKASGANRRRPELARMIADAKANRFRALLVWSLSRLGRDLVHTVEIARELHVDHDVAIAFHLQPTVDMTSVHGRLVFHVLAAVAELQREELVEATKRGMAAAAAKGKHVGRPPASSRLSPGQVAWVAQTQGVTFAARNFGLSRNTVRKIRDEYQAEIGAGDGPAASLVLKNPPPEG